MRAAEEISWIFWRLNVSTGELKQLPFMTCPWVGKWPDDAVVGLGSMLRGGDSVNQANAPLPAKSNPRSCEIDRTAESTSLDSAQFSLAQSSRDAPG